MTLDGAWDGTSVTEFVDQAAASALAVGDSFVVQFQVIVDLDAGGTSGPLNNQVVASGNGVDPDGNIIPAADNSDSGSDPNGNNPNDQGDNGTSDDPTPLLIPDVGLAKVAGAAVPNLSLIHI